MIYMPSELCKAEKVYAQAIEKASNYALFSNDIEEDGKYYIYYHSVVHTILHYIYYACLASTLNISKPNDIYVYISVVYCICMQEHT